MVHVMNSCCKNGCQDLKISEDGLLGQIENGEIHEIHWGKLKIAPEEKLSYIKGRCGQENVS